MKNIKKAKYIWLKNSKNTVNEYVDFKEYFTVKNPDFVEIKISCVSDYVLYINDKFVGFNQYPNFKEKKFYDVYNLKKYLKSGINKLYIIALSKNYNTSSCIKDDKGLLFEITNKNKVLCYSNSKTKSRLDSNYKSGIIHNITPQLGMSYEYSFTTNKNSYDNSIIIKHKCKILKRPIKKLDISNKVIFNKISDHIFEAKKEIAGYLYFKIIANKDCHIKIRYGEHIKDNDVRYKIHNRLFELNFDLKKGVNEFTGYFLRLGLRYLSIDNVTDLKILEIGILQALYPHKTIDIATNDKQIKKILNKSLYTLDCCMHEHYEDCPWREQAQYTMDSRTQINIAYESFKNYEFIKANLEMMSYRLTNQNVLCITSPSSSNLSIPTYSLIYPLMVKEYYQNTKDISLVKVIYKNTKIMINHYIDELIDDLLPHQAEWNFYEWEKGLHNEKEIFKQIKIINQFDLPLNAFMIIALENFAYICNLLHKPTKKYIALANKIKKKAHDTFIAKSGLFYTYNKDNKKYHLSEYANIMAIYANICNKKEKDYILNILTSKNNLIPLTLSNYIFKYEILLESSKYDDYMINDIKHIWGYMDRQNASTYWETILGEKDFSGAGSLCHGWSAVPAYVFYKLKKKGKI